MGGLYNQYYINGFVLDWSIIKPDLGFQYVQSYLACAILCWQEKCITINIMPDDSVYGCQMSMKKGSCMEKEEAFEYPGSRMFQKKVANVF
jgi:hypothetical protein